MKKLFLLIISLISIGVLVSFSGCIGDNTTNANNNNNILENGTIVSVDYVLKLENGTIIDTSIESVAKEAGIYNPNRPYQPLTFTIGDGKMIKGFNDAVKTMKVGEEKTVVIPAKEAYGERNESLIQKVPIEAFNNTNITIKKGTKLYVKGYPAEIYNYSNEYVWLDFNSPLAGKNLVFTIKLINITYPNK